jgi:hypothetical protein
MAFTEEFFGPHRWQQFMFFAQGSAVTSFINETVSIGRKWMLQEVRLHFSTAMGSVKYYTVQISATAAALSAYNTLLLSTSLNGVQDYNLYYSTPMVFASNQDLVIATSVLSVANQYGLQVIGWAVID